MSRRFLAERIAATKAAIEEAETAISEVSSGGVHSYSINTGQTTQNVTMQNLGTFNAYLSSLYNRLATLEARLCGGSLYGRPGF